jgi:DNA polymerase III subunit beta
MTAHDPNGFDPLILDALHIPVQRLLTICRQLAPAYQRRVTIPVLETVLIDGAFPDYTRVIPRGPTRLTMTTSANAMRRLRPFATQRSNAICFENGKATLRDPDTLGEVSVPVTMTPAMDGVPEALVKHYENGRTEAWGFNLRFLLDQAGVTPTFRLDVTSPNDPARIFGEDPDAMWILMPMRV